MLHTCTCRGARMFTGAWFKDRNRTSLPKSFPTPNVSAILTVQPAGPFKMPLVLCHISTYWRHAWMLRCSRNVASTPGASGGVLPIRRGRMLKSQIRLRKYVQRFHAQRFHAQAHPPIASHSPQVCMSTLKRNLKPLRTPNPQKKGKESSTNIHSSRLPTPTTCILNPVQACEASLYEILR